MVFSKLAQVVIDVQKSGIDVDLALGLPYCRLNGGAHLETGERNGNGGAAINNSVFTQQDQFSTSGCSYCWHGSPQYQR